MWTDGQTDGGQMDRCNFQLYAYKSIKVVVLPFGVYEVGLADSSEQKYWPASENECFQGFLAGYVLSERAIASTPPLAALTPITIGVGAQVLHPTIDE